MSETTITLNNGIELPLVQALALARLSEEHPASTWHLANCGCCVCFHPGGDTTRGYLVGRDGESDYHEGQGHE